MQEDSDSDRQSAAGGGTLVHESVASRSRTRAAGPPTLCNGHHVAIREGTVLEPEA